VSIPNIPAITLTIPVLTAQVAPTILEALGLNPSTLQAVQQQGHAGDAGNLSDQEKPKVVVDHKIAAGITSARFFCAYRHSVN